MKRVFILASLICFALVRTLRAAPGDLDLAFNPGLNGAVWSIQEFDGKILIGGDFTAVHGATRRRIARVYNDGTVDSTFDPGAGADGSVRSIALQTDGRILLSGGFGAINGTNRNAIARLNLDGSLDATFNPGAGADLTIRSVAVQEDGKVIVGGHFSMINGTKRSRMARLNADGSLDIGFNSPTLTAADGDPWVYSVALQNDGKVMIGGNFTKLGGVARNNIARLNTDGSLDLEFDTGAGANDSVRKVAMQSDGKVLAVGWLTSINGTNRNYVARLNSDGSLDTTFDPGAGANDRVECVAVQTDGKVLIGGSFTSINGEARNHIARLNTDGSLDATFNPSGGANNSVYALSVQTDGEVLMGGAFTKVNGVAQGYAARLLGDHKDQGMEFILLSVADKTLYSVETPLTTPSVIGPASFGNDPVELIEASPDQLYTLDRAANTLITLDRFSGQVIASVTLDQDIVVRPRGFDLSPGGELYGVFAGMQLRRIDPFTGITTLGVPITGASQLEAIAFAPNGTLFASGSIANSASSDTLFRLSIPTGELAVIGNMGAVDVDDLTFGSDGFLYGVNSQNSVNAHLLRIDPATARLQDIGNTGVAGVTGILAIREPDLPALSIARSNASVVLSWSTNAIGFAIEHTVNLGPLATWIRLSEDLAIIDRRYVVTNPPLGETQFFRL